jgi:AcrR family transcriptional regulator
MTPRRVVQEELSRDKILFTAAGMFVEDGYKAVSMRKIAQALGYSHGAIYYHYKDKAELFGAIVVRDFRRLMVVLDQTMVSAPNPQISTVENVFVEYIRFGFENKPQYELMFLIEDPEHCAITEKNLSYAKFAETVMQLVGNNDSQTDGTTMFPYSVFLSLHGFVAYYLHTEQTFEDVQLLAHVHAKLLYQGLLSMLG